MISLFTGIGGLDYGFEAAGFENLVTVEWDRDCCDTIRNNRHWQVIEKDIHDTSSEEILSVAGVKPGEAALVVGGPPCQPFSKSAYWAHGDTRRLEDPRAGTLTAFMRCIEDTLPEAFIFENVHGIMYSGKEEGLLNLMRPIACELFDVKWEPEKKTKWWKIGAGAAVLAGGTVAAIILLGSKDEDTGFPDAPDRP